MNNRYWRQDLRVFGQHPYQSGHHPQYNHHRQRPVQQPPASIERDIERNPHYSGPYPYSDILSARNNLIYNLENTFNNKLDKVKPKLYLNSSRNGIAYPTPGPIGAVLLKIPATQGCRIIRQLNPQDQVSSPNNVGQHVRYADDDDDDDDDDDESVQDLTQDDEGTLPIEDLLVLSALDDYSDESDQEVLEHPSRTGKRKAKDTMPGNKAGESNSRVTMSKKTGQPEVVTGKKARQIATGKKAAQSESKSDSKHVQSTSQSTVTNGTTSSRSSNGTESDDRKEILPFCIDTKPSNVNIVISDDEDEEKPSTSETVAKKAVRGKKERKNVRDRKELLDLPSGIMLKSESFYKCDFCDYTNNNEIEMRTHFRSTKHNMASSCVRELGTTYITTEKSVVAQHFNRPLWIVCPVCCEVFPDIHVCAFHHKKMHQSENGSYSLHSVKSSQQITNDARCRTCHKQFQSWSQIFKHWKTQPAHNPVTKLAQDRFSLVFYKCLHRLRNKECGRMFRDAQSCFGHCSSHQEDIITFSATRLAAKGDTLVKMPNKYDVVYDDDYAYDLKKLKDLKKNLKKIGGGNGKKKALKRLITVHKQWACK